MIFKWCFWESILRMNEGRLEKWWILNNFTKFRRKFRSFDIIQGKFWLFFLINSPVVKLPTLLIRANSSQLDKDKNRCNPIGWSKVESFRNCWINLDFFARINNSHCFCWKITKERTRRVRKKCLKEWWFVDGQSQNHPNAEKRI